MGRVAAFAAGEADCRAALRHPDRLVGTTEETKSTLSTYQPASTLGLTGRRPVGETFPVPAELCDLFGQTRGWWEASGSLVEPTVLRERHGRPNCEELQAARPASGPENLGIDLSVYSVTRLAEVGLDARGCGKGLALGQVVVAAQEHRQALRTCAPIGW